MKKKINSKHYNKWKIIDIVAIIIICILSFLLTALNGTVEEELKYVSSSNDDLLYFIVLIICSLPSLLGYVALYFGIRYTIKKIEKKNLTYNASKDILYYREALESLTPFEISILTNLNIEERKDVAATILWYQNKKYIDIKNEEFIFYDNINLTEKDKYFLTFLKTKDLGYLESYKNMIYEELKIKKYIVENDYHSKTIQSIIKNILIIIGLFILTIGLILLNVFFIKNMVLQKIIDLVIIIIDLIITYKKVASFMIGYANRKSKYQRTITGEEKTTYIHALQNFIHDFSNLKDYDKEQIILWEDFLIYAIVLEQNDKIVENIAKMFNEKYSNGNFTSVFNFLISKK